MKRLPLVFLSLFILVTCLWIASSNPSAGKAAPTKAIPWWFGDDWDDFYHEYACVDGMNLWVMAVGEDAAVGDTFTIKATLANSGLVVADETLSFQYQGTDNFSDRPYAEHKIMWSETLQPGTVVRFESESEAFMHGTNFPYYWKAYIRDCTAPTHLIPSQFRRVFAQNYTNDGYWWALELPIPPGGCAVKPRMIASATDFVISDADISIEVISDEPASISATLTSPAGTMVKFVDGNHTPNTMFGSPTTEYDEGEGIDVAGAQRNWQWPGYANNFIFDDDSVYQLADMDTAFIDIVVKPWPDNLDDFNGENSAGKWYLEICNNMTSGNAILQKWAIILEQDIAPPAITDLVAIVLSENSALVEWQTDEPADSLVSYGTSSGVHPLEESDSALVTDHAVTLTGLTPDTTYYFVVSSADGAGNTAQSQEGSFVTDSVEVEYSLAVASSGQGTVQINPNKPTYQNGEIVTLTAIPDSGYQFAGWSGDASGTANPIQITMDSNKSVTTFFELVEPGTYTLETLTSGGGSIDRNPDKPVYQSGETVILSAIADVGYQFTGWSGDTGGDGNPLQLVMNDNKAITANFELIDLSDPYYLYTPVVVR